jgi:flagellar motor switch protein FliG
MAQQLARITPRRLPVATAGKALSGKEKAAVVVRLLIAQGAQIPLSSLPEELQAELTEQMALMRLVDRDTLAAVADEFAQAIESVGLSFPGGIDGALSLLSSHISPSAASRLRRMASLTGRGDPWERILPLPPDRLVPLLDEESIEVCAVLLSKLPVAKSAELLSRIKGERARRIAHAVSRTGNIEPDTVARIGQALALQLDAQPPRAFEAAPEARVGAILNVATAATRDSLLEALNEDDAEFAARVRKAIFTFAHVPARLSPRDVPKLTRAVPQPQLVAALAGATEGLAAVAEFILTNMSQRMAQTLREEMAERGKIPARESEEAQAAVVEAIRNMEAAGEVVLVQEEE